MTLALALCLLLQLLLLLLVAAIASRFICNGDKLTSRTIGDKLGHPSVMRPGNRLDTVMLSVYLIGGCIGRKAV